MNLSDVLIITALPEDFDAAKVAGLSDGVGAPGVTHWQEYPIDELAPFLLGEYLTVTGRRLSVALARPIRSENPDEGQALA